MGTETIASHNHPLVFADSNVATHMPFFDGTTLVFCRSGSPVAKTLQNTGTIWKTIRRNKVLAERFKNFPRSQKIQYRAWKLAYCNWGDKVVHSIATGLRENAAERSPSFYREDGRIHLSFISGVPSEAGHSYRLYTCSGPDLGHLEPAKPFFNHRLFFGFVSPHHVCWGAHNILQLTERASGKTFRLKADFYRIASVTFLASDPAKLLITGLLDREHKYQTILYDLATGGTSDVSVGGPIYKSSLHGNHLIFVQKLSGFENRELCHDDYMLSPSTTRISKTN